MAGELQFLGDPEADSGAVVTFRVYDSLGAQVGVEAPAAEVGTLAIYIGDMPTAPAGEYIVRFFDGTDLLGQGCISWDGVQEIDPNLLLSRTFRSELT